MEKLKYGMAGGGAGSYIGSVHKRGAEIDGMAELVCGCFSRHMDKNKKSAELYHLPDPERIYADYREMAEKESEREDGIDFAVIATPNASHFEMVKCFILHGIDVMCDKPLTISSAEAEELERLAKENHITVGVSYGYTGYPVIRQARRMIENGTIGDVIHVRVSHPEEWVIESMPEKEEDAGPLSWRFNHEIAGPSLCTSDLGTHAEELLAQFTGLYPKRVLAMLDTYPRYLPSETNSTVLLDLGDGVSGELWASQIAEGHSCGPQIYVIGTKGSLEWHHENPDNLIYSPKGEPSRILEAGKGYMLPDSNRRARVDAGHHEGFFEAFGNIYREFYDARRAAKEGKDPSSVLFTGIHDGVKGVRFVEACLKSQQNGNVWVEV